METGRQPRMVCRNDFLIIAAATAVVAGLLLPLPAYVLDVLVILSVSLTTAVLIIAFSARQVLEVRCFPLLIVAATMLRAAISVSSAKLIVAGDHAGTITSIFGHSIVRDNFASAISILLIGAVVVFASVSRAVRSIRQTSSEFMKCVIPHKETSISSDLNTGLINCDQARNLRERIINETGFFVAMTGAARFMLLAAAFELAIIVFNTVGCVRAGATVPTTAETAAGLRFCEVLRTSTLEAHAIATVGTGIIIQISSLLTAIASGYLVRRSCMGAADMEAGDHVVKRVVATEVGCSKVGGLPKDSKASSPGEGEHASKGLAHSDLSRAAERHFSFLPDTSQYDYPAELTETTEFTATADNCRQETAAAQNTHRLKESTADSNQHDWNSTTPDYDSDRYYDAITKLIEERLANEAKTVLMCAESVAELPVTIPVNITMRLARKGQRCLLVDLDLERNAIAKAFDAAGDSLKPREEKLEMPTCINNLWVWPARNLNKDGGEVAAIELTQVIAGMKNRYDRLILYAPSMKLLTDREHLATCVQAAILFDGPKNEIENSLIGDFGRLLAARGCIVFGPEEIPAKPTPELSNTVGAFHTSTED